MSQELEAVLSLRDAMSQQLESIRAAVTKLGDSFASTQKSAQQAMQSMKSSVSGLSSGFQQAAGGMDLFDKTQARAIGTSARMIGRLVALQAVSQTLNSALGTQGLSGGAKAAHDGLSAFATLAVLMPTPVGLAGAAVAGLATAFISLRNAQKEAEDQARHLAVTMAEQRKAIFDEAGKLDAELLTSKNPAMAANERGIENLKTAIGQQIGLRKMAQASLSHETDQGGYNATLFTQQIREADANIQKLTEDLAKLEEEKDKLGFDQAANAIHEEVMAGLVSPLEAASERLKLIEAQIKELIKQKDALNPDDYANRLDALLQKGASEKAIINADKLQQQLDQAGKSIDEWSLKSGIALDDVTRGKLEALAVNNKKELGTLLEDLRKQVEANPLSGLQLSLNDLAKSAYNFRSGFTSMFQSIESGVSDAFASVILKTQSFADAMKNLSKNILGDLVKLLTNFVSQTALSGLAGAALSLFPNSAQANNNVPTVQGSAGAIGGFVQPGQQGSGVSLASITGASGGGTTSGLGGALGISSSLAAEIGGAGIGAGIAYGGISSGNRTQGAAGGAILGLSIGAIAGPIGAAAGAIIGGIAGFFTSSAARRRRLRRQRAAAAAAAAAYQAQLDQAKLVLKQDIRNRLGGGLATEGAAADVGHLFSGEISNSELLQFGSPQAIASQAAAVAAQSTVNNRVTAPINVTAYIDGTYSVERLAADLSYHLQSNMGGLP